MATLGDIFDRFGPAYLARYGTRMPAVHERALRDIAKCRTVALGGHRVLCEDCGREHYHYHSCGNRNCPLCGGAATAAWLDKQQQKLLPVRYFHVVFTLPASLRRIFRSHQRVMVSALFQCASRALMELAADPKHLGSRIGVLAVLHTWGRNLSYHPHLHCLVPAGGVDKDGKWIPSRPKFLVPLRPLGRLFRGKFMAEAKRRLPHVDFPHDVWDKDWVVSAKATVYGADMVLAYLGRYVHRTAITNSRILSASGNTVTFRYLDHRDDKTKVMTLETFEFMRRVLQHVPPKGLHRVRSYGLLHHAHKSALADARDQLTPSTQSPPPPLLTINLVSNLVSAAAVAHHQSCEQPRQRSHSKPAPMPLLQLHEPRHPRVLFTLATTPTRFACSARTNPQTARVGPMNARHTVSASDCSARCSVTRVLKAGKRVDIRAFDGLMVVGIAPARPLYGTLMTQNTTAGW